MYKVYNPNPIGARVGDCVVRALCKATGQSWGRTFMGLCIEAFRLFDMPSSNHVWGSRLKHLGYRRRILPDSCPDCYTVSDFGRDHPHGTYVLALSNHVVCVQDGDWYDTWDSGNEVPVYYWIREDDA